MFIDPAAAQRIERAEAAATRDTAGGLAGSDRAPRAFIRELGPGVAAYVRAGSPLNKLIGVGIDGRIDESGLAAVEAAYRELNEPLRAEIATLAAPEVWEQLGARGYRLQEIENVLCRSLQDAPPPADGDVRVERVAPSALPAFAETLVAAFCHPDGSGAALDQLTRDVIETAVEDSLAASGVARYLARRDGAIAGAASMRVHDGVAVLNGSATLPTDRKRGIQAALLARRLGDARAGGADLAIVTTAPGTQSQANAMKAGFALAYARAVLILPPG
ncbi:MAG TPA: GNAT family N-acetyltransferase [Polyangia bacterium]|nr:GNAT family N-acetyltransferase [Polyangia bacterium]